MQTKAEIQQLLRNNVCVIVFEKADKSQRTLIGTLSEDFVNDPSYSTREANAGNDDLVTVWDVEAEGWRAFKISKLLEKPIVTLKVGTDTYPAS